MLFVPLNKDFTEGKKYLSVFNMDQTTTFVLTCAAIVAIIFIVFGCQKQEDYSNNSNNPEFGTYKQMSRLPWCTPPTGIGALGESECMGVRYMYPGDVFNTGKVPLSCPPSRYSIYQTGNSQNPNVHNTWGVITPENIRY